MLTTEEIKRRLIRLSNLERLYAVARGRIVSLEKENEVLKARIKELEDTNTDQNAKIEALSFQFEQIKIKLFGKKPDVLRIATRKENKERDICSYQRPVPRYITEVKLHRVNECTHCQGRLEKKRISIFFEEDIPLPIQKTVTQHEVEVGYCSMCKRQTSGCSIPPKRSILGENVKKYVCVLSIANRLSHTQIQEHLRDIFDLNVSIGEIGNILQTESDTLRPAYQALSKSLLSQTGIHYDETSWKVQKEEQGRFAWVATGTENNNTIFSLGRSRGKGNIEDIGKGTLGITDDYGAYKNSFENHQLCWAHPQRKLRDMAESKEFGEREKEQILRTYRSFSNLYHNIRKRIQNEISPSMKTRFQNIFNQISESHSLDPTPLAKLKTSLRKNRKKYFTFLRSPGIPVDNNKAERALRHLVIKRKTSFGSKTQRGAETTSILASIILSLKWNDPNNWFQKYLDLNPQKTP